MIIRCPECETGFQLPAEQVTPKGVKVRCSKCAHVFRIRSSDGEDPEIFYRDGDNEEEVEEEKPKSTKSSPLPGLGLKPKTSSVFGDLKKKKSDAFGGAFDDDDEPKTLELSAMDLADEFHDEAEDLEEGLASPPAKKPFSIAAAPKKEKPKVESKPAPKTVEPSKEKKKSSLPEPEEEVEESESAFSPSSSVYGSPEDHVDPSFGTDGPSFDAEIGKVVETPKSAAPKRGGKKPPGAVGPPPTALPRADEKKEAPLQPAAPPVAAAKPSADWDDDLAAHKIGGGAGTKVVMFLFLLSLVAMGFFAVVAQRNDGFLDFRAFPEMLEVAFGEGEYTPRPEWTVAPPPTIVRGAASPVTVESVHGELIQIGRTDRVLVVRGLVRNNENVAKNGVELRASIATPEGRVRREIAGPLGIDVPPATFGTLTNLEAARDLVRDGQDRLEPNELLPFTLLFDAPPASVLAGESYLLRVEVGGSHGAATVASQD